MTSAKADELFKKAESAIAGGFLGLSKDYEKGYERFVSAAAQYKLDKNYHKAGEAYMRAGDCAIKLKNQYEASQAYVDSANAYKKVDIKQATTMLKLAIDMNIENNRLGAAAKLEKEFAEALEKDGNLSEAIEHYQKANNYYHAEDQPQAAIGCKGKIAALYGELDKFAECVTLYEEIAEFYTNGPMKHQSREPYVRALICRAAQINNDNRGEMAAECAEAWTTYTQRDPNLRYTREAEFIAKLLESVEENDIEKFEDGVQMLDELRLLDDWKTHVLLVMKKNFEDIT